MPELPEVETVKNALKNAIIGTKILNVEIFCRRFRIEIVPDFEQRILNATIVNLKRIAKYIIIELDNGNSIIWHLGMSGKIKTCITRPDILQKHDHIVITLTDKIIIYNDARRFGLVDVTESKNLSKHPFFKNIGIDPFDKQLTAQYLFDKLRKIKTVIKIALLDQKIINGIGNIYASEALYISGISPVRESKDITYQECESLITAIRNVLEKAIKAGGSTLKDYIRPDGSTGYFQNQHCVYNKTGQRCPNCICDIIKTKGIRKIKQGGRSTFYCETLQK